MGGTVAFGGSGFVCFGGFGVVLTSGGGTKDVALAESVADAFGGVVTVGDGTAASCCSGCLSTGGLKLLD